MMTAHSKAYTKDSYEAYAYAQSLKSLPPPPSTNPRMFSLEEMLAPAKESKQLMRHLIRFIACKGRILRTKENQLNITELLIKWRN